MKKFIYILILIVMLFSITFCKKREKEKKGIYVVATTGLIGDAAKNIGKNKIQLTVLLHPGIDPHTYELRASDIAKFKKADVILYNGLDLEAKMSRVLKQFKNKIVVPVGEAIPKNKLLAWVEDGKVDGYDPHVWNNAENWIYAVKAARDALIKKDKINEKFYTDNCKNYIDRIKKAHEYVKQIIAKIPKDKRVLITAHDAFSYYGKAYGIKKIYAIQGVSTETEASAANIKKLAELIVKYKVPAIFIEDMINDKAMKALQKAAEAEGFTVKIGNVLYSDSLSEKGKGADTYVKFLKHNADAIFQGLTGK